MKQCPTSWTRSGVCLIVPYCTVGKCSNIKVHSTALANWEKWIAAIPVTLILWSPSWLDCDCISRAWVKYSKLQYLEIESLQLCKCFKALETYNTIETINWPLHGSVNALLIADSPLVSLKYLRCTVVKVVWGKWSVSSLNNLVMLPLSHAVLGIMTFSSTQHTCTHR